MNINRTEVIYVSDELTNVINKDKEVSSLFSSLNFKDIYTNAEINELINTFERAVKDNEKIALLKFYNSLNKLLEESIKSTQKERKKLVNAGKGSRTNQDYYFQMVKEDELCKKKRVVEKIVKILVDNYESHLIKELIEVERNFKYFNFIRDCYKYRDDNSKIHIFSINELNDLIRDEQIHFDQLTSFEEGQIYIKHPFRPNYFIDMNTTEGEIFNEKMICLAKIAQLLGATKLNGAAEFIEQKERVIDDNGQLGYAEYRLSYEEKKELAETYKSKYHQEYNFVGGLIEGNWEKAKDEAKECGLINDKNINLLMELRNPSIKNTFKSNNISFEMTKEINQSIDIAFGLIITNIKINKKYREILKTRKTVNYNFEIVF